MNYLEIKVIPPSSTSVTDIEATLEDLYMSALKAVFIHDREFIYSTEKKNGRLEITLEYPEKLEAPLAKPHLLLSNISYSINFDTSLMNNFYQDQFNPLGTHTNTVQKTIIPYNITITALGGKSVSKNLANRVINYIGLTYKDVFKEIGLNIMSVNKSPTTSAARYPERVFETSIQIQGRLEWTGIVSNIKAADGSSIPGVEYPSAPNRILDGHVLKAVKADVKIE